MGFRRAARGDTNQKKIVKELRGFGYDVDIVHRLKNLYDLVVSGRISHKKSVRAAGLRVEVKYGKGKVRDNQIEYSQKQNHKSNLIIARCAGHVLDWFGDKSRLQIHRASCEECNNG